MIEDAYIIEDKYIKYNFRVQFLCNSCATRMKNRVKKGKTGGKKGKGRQ